MVPMVSSHCATALSGSPAALLPMCSPSVTIASGSRFFTSLTVLDNPLPPETKNNLIKLADYVSSKTLEIGKNVDDINQKTLDSMIMTNLQISEGLMTKRIAC